MDALHINSVVAIEQNLLSLSTSPAQFLPPQTPYIRLKYFNDSACVVGHTCSPALPLTGVRIPEMWCEPIEGTNVAVDNFTTHSGKMHSAKGMTESIQDVNLVDVSISYHPVVSHTPKILHKFHDAYALPREGTPIMIEILCVLLHNCVTNKDLVTGRHVHLLIVSSGLDFLPELGDSLIHLYALCASFEAAELFFCKVALPRVSTWHAIISACIMHEENEKALDLYTRMVEEIVIPNSYIFTCVLKSCASLRDLTKGQLIHDDIVKLGLQSDMYVASSLIDFYTKCGSTQKAHNVFSTLPCKNVVIWSAMIDAYIQQGCLEHAFQLCEEMRLEGIEPNEFTYSSLVSACGSAGNLWQGLCLHDQITQNGLESDPCLASTIIDMYAKCRSLTEAHEVFIDLSNPTLICWNSLIAGYARNGDDLAALQVFDNMEKKGCRPNNITFSCSLKACGYLEDIQKGKVIHAQIITCGLDADEYIQSSLIDMYSKCGSLDEACKVFDYWPHKSIVSWGALMAGYVQHDLGLPVLNLFEKMQKEGLKPNKYIYSSVLKACGSLVSLKEGIVVHEQIRKRGLEICIFLGSSLIDMYAKCGNIGAAREVFEELPHRNAVCWGAMMAGYVQNEHPLLAFRLYEKMHGEGIKPDKAIHMCILEACGTMGSLGYGQVIHYQIIESGLNSDIMVGNALADMYNKCDCLEEAHYVFNGLQHRNEMSWATMVIAYAQSSNFLMAWQCLKDMVEERFMPDEVLLTEILTACRRSGQFKEGWKFFRSMRQIYNIKPTIENYGCMVNILGEGGYLAEAEELLDILPLTPDSVAWLSLLAACRVHRNIDLGLKCFREVVKLDPGMTMAYVQMAGIYAEAGMWENRHMIDEQRRQAGAWKIPGKAWIEVNNEVHEFVVGDRTHPQSSKIYSTLRRLAVVLKDQGYVPQLGVVGGTTEENKEEGAADKNYEEAMLGHCEKLAIAFGLLSTPEGATLRVVKNLRVCIDCHNASKIISKVERREIIINDAYRVHHFNAGECSCEQNLTRG